MTNCSHESDFKNETLPSLIELSTKPNVYSWSTKVTFVTNSVGGFKDFSDSSACLLWGNQFILTLQTIKLHPNLSGSGASGFQLTLDAGDTACNAEELGKRLAYSILALALDHHWGLALSWSDTPLPCRIIDRTVSRGDNAQFFGSITSHISIKEFSSQLGERFNDATIIPYKLLLSMELCASSRFGNDNRAKLILLVSALEALSEQRDLSKEIGSLVKALQAEIEKVEFSDDSLKESISGQVKNLVRESARRGIKRILNDAKLSSEDIKFVEKAYSARSKIVHEGLRVPELGIVNAKLDQILQTIYRSLMRNPTDSDEKLAQPDD